jgi:hypothetical protein
VPASVAGGGQVAGHGRAHDAQADESDVHDGVPKVGE